MFAVARRRRVQIAAGAAVLLVGSGLGLLLMTRNAVAPIVVGKVDITDVPLRTDPGPPEVDVPQFAPDPLLGSGGFGPGAALPFRGAVNVPNDLKFFLVIGSDARPGQDPGRARADSVHIAAVDPLTREGTVLGLPRDALVNVPGHGRQKINSALALGGPELMVRTVRDLTGFPISYYAVTGFEGIVKIVNSLKGVEVKVPYRMDDRYSGARFEPGWHHMNGPQVLAFTRARHGVPGGDLGRSENQGRVIVHALEKMRATTRAEGGIRRWLDVLFRYARLDMSLTDAVDLGMLARHIAPADLRNVVAQGKQASAGGQSVIVLDEEAFDLFRDVGADAEADGDEQRGAPKDPPPGTKPGPKSSPEPTSEPTSRPTSKPGRTPAPTPRPTSGVKLPV